MNSIIILHNSEDTDIIIYPHFAPFLTVAEVVFFVAFTGFNAFLCEVLAGESFMFAPVKSVSKVLIAFSLAAFASSESCAGSISNTFFTFQRLVTSLKLILLLYLPVTFSRSLTYQRAGLRTEHFNFVFFPDTHPYYVLT